MSPLPVVTPINRRANYTGPYHHSTHHRLSNNKSPHWKCYKALIDSGAAVLRIRYSAYQLIDDSFKTPIQATTTTLNTPDGLPMTALGMAALHLRIAKFKFTHNFIICDRLPDTEIILALMFKRNSHYHMHGQEKKLLYSEGQQIPHISPKLQRQGDSRNC